MEIVAKKQQQSFNATLAMIKPGVPNKPAFSVNSCDYKNTNAKTIEITIEIVQNDLQRDLVLAQYVPTCKTSAVNLPMPCHPSICITPGLSTNTTTTNNACQTDKDTEPSKSYQPTQTKVSQENELNEVLPKDSNPTTCIKKDIVSTRHTNKECQIKNDPPNDPKLPRSCKYKSKYTKVLSSHHMLELFRHKQQQLSSKKSLKKITIKQPKSIATSTNRDNMTAVQVSQPRYNPIKKDGLKLKWWTSLPNVNIQPARESEKEQLDQPFIKNTSDPKNKNNSKSRTLKKSQITVLQNIDIPASTSELQESIVILPKAPLPTIHTLDENVSSKPAQAIGQYYNGCKLCTLKENYPQVLEDKKSKQKVYLKRNPIAVNVEERNLAKYTVESLSKPEKPIVTFSKRCRLRTVDTNNIKMLPSINLPVVDARKEVDLIKLKERAVSGTLTKPKSRANKSSQIFELQPSVDVNNEMKMFEFQSDKSKKINKYKFPYQCDQQYFKPSTVQSKDPDNMCSTLPRNNTKFTHELTTKGPESLHINYPSQEHVKPIFEKMFNSNEELIIIFQNTRWQQYGLPGNFDQPNSTTMKFESFKDYVSDLPNKCTQNYHEPTKREPERLQQDIALPEYKFIHIQPTEPKQPLEPPKPFLNCKTNVNHDLEENFRNTHSSKLISEGNLHRHFYKCEQKPPTYSSNEDKRDHDKYSNIRKMLRYMNADLEMQPVRWKLSTELADVTDEFEAKSTERPRTFSKRLVELSKPRVQSLKYETKRFLMEEAERRRHKAKRDRDRHFVAGKRLHDLSIPFVR